MNCPGGQVCSHPPTGLEQSVEEMDFARSACSAALNSDVAKLQRCLERNPACIHHDGAGGGSGYTPLHYAARGGHGEAVALLLAAKASVHACTSGGATPLMRAAFAGHAPVVQQLVRAGAALDAQDSDGETALHKAAAQRHGAVLQALQQAASRASGCGASSANASIEGLRNRNGLTAGEVWDLLGGTPS